MYAQDRFPMELYEMGLPPFVYESVCMDTKTFHHPKAPGNCPIAHEPNLIMKGFGTKGYKIIKRIMCRGGLGNFTVWFGLHSMYQIGKLHGVLNEKNGHIIAYKVPSAFLGIKFY